MTTPLLSVITVCRNAADLLPATMESLSAQTWTKYEYLIIDGASADSTLELISNACASFSGKGADLRFLSEPDRGIYDAMNKGARMARGR